MQEIWHDVDTDRDYILREGRKLPCNSLGHPKIGFTLYSSGCSKPGRKEEEVVAGRRLGRPLSLLHLKKDAALSCPAQSKLSGYAQFPRPLDPAFSNIPKKVRRKQLGDVANWISKANFLSSFNKSALARKTDPAATCSYFTLPRFSFNMKRVKSDRMQESAPQFPPREEYFSLNSSQRELLNGSSLKSKFLPSLKGTFCTITDQSNITEDIVGVMDEAQSRARSTKNIHEIKEELKREMAELQGYAPPVEREIRVNPVGVFSVRVPSEGDLFGRSLEFRGRANPVAAAESNKRETLDSRMVRKKREQTALKNLAMGSFVRSEEKRKLRDLIQAQPSIVPPKRVRIRLPRSLPKLSP